VQIQAASQSTFINAQLYSTCDYREQKQAANIIKLMQTHIYQKKYINGSLNLEEDL
jgi:hypothetical protein